MLTRVMLCVCLLLMMFSANIFSQDASFNLSVEPEESGSLVVGNANIRWNSNFYSIFNLFWNKSSDTSSAIPRFGTSIQTQDVERMQLDLLPITMTFPVNGLTLELSGGGSVVNMDENVSALMKDTGGILLNPPGQYAAYSSKRHALIISPRIGIAVAGVNIAIVKLYYTGFISPIYFLSLNQEVSYDFLDSPSANSITRWSSPYIDQSLSMEIYSFFRIAIEHSFQRLDFQSMDWENTGTRLVGVDDVQNINELRLGIELLLPVRAGTVRLKCGVFWINDTTSSSYWKTTTNDAKMLFRFGIEG